MDKKEVYVENKNKLMVETGHESESIGEQEDDDDDDSEDSKNNERFENNADGEQEQAQDAHE